MSARTRSLNWSRRGDGGWTFGNYDVLREIGERAHWLVLYRGQAFTLPTYVLRRFKTDESARRWAERQITKQAREGR